MSPAGRRRGGGPAHDQIAEGWPRDHEVDHKRERRLAVPAQKESLRLSSIFYSTVKLTANVEGRLAASAPPDTVHSIAACQSASRHAVHDAQGDFRMHHGHNSKHATGVHSVCADVKGRRPEHFKRMAT